MTTTEQYLKRKTSGLHTPAVTEIKNLAEYIDLFSSGEFTNYLFRGEPTNYHETFSSGLRNTTPLVIDQNKELKTQIPFLICKKSLKKKFGTN